MDGDEVVFRGTGVNLSRPADFPIGIIHENDGTTTLYGNVIDQAALQGILKKINNFNLELISVNKINGSSKRGEKR